MAASTSNDVSKPKKTYSESVKLGFIEEDTDCRLLNSKFFPSKVGGKPAWLSLEPIPDYNVLLCDKCSGPTLFLMQVYAPLSERDDTFHRMLLLFVCTKESCQVQNSSSNFKVIRSQLPLINQFYSNKPPNEDSISDEDVALFPDASKFQNLCEVCGVSSSKKCSKCKKVFYCSRDHQTMDWKFYHKKKCGQEDSSDSNKTASKFNTTQYTTI